MPTDEPLPETTPQVLAPGNLPYQMFLLVQLMTKRFQEVLDPFGITPLHWGILSCLWVEDGLRTSEIAQRLEQLGGTVTVGLDAMVARGLIERRKDAKDGRVLRILLTRKAFEMEGLLKPEVDALLGRLFVSLTQESYGALYHQVASLRKTIAGA